MTSKIENAPSAPSPTSAIDRGGTARTTALDVDWTKAAQAAFGSALFAGLVGGAVYVISKVIEADMRAATERAPNDDAYTPFVYATSDSDEVDAHLADDAASEDDDDDDVPAEAAPATVVDEKTAQAAALLGIAASSSEDEVRAALRARLSSSRLHPDHGGDGEQAKRLIAAKNLLIERARAVRS